MSNQSDTNREFEYIVVGSGAGGGTVAARLAESGCKVLVLEAGGDPHDLQGGGPAGKDRMPDDYNVPVFHAFAAENEAMSWDFFPRHYASEERQKEDPKYDPKDGGVFYPRAGTLGGCTAHNALIMVYPHNEDWNYIAYMTGDSSWKAENMHKYFERLEMCRHRFSIYRWLSKLGINLTRHGWEGWLQTEVAIPKDLLESENLLRTIKKSARKAFKEVAHPLRRFWWLIQGQADPNDWRLVKDNAIGIRYAPLTTKDHARTSTRERLLDVKKKYPDNLTIELDAHVTQIILNKDHRAIGVEYLKGERLYQAYKNPSKEPGEKKKVYASREVILAGGAFNTPQLLMLSGIGPREELEKHHIDVKVELPGVGTNLQDRYEVGMVYKMNFPHWHLLKDAKFEKGDPPYEEWAQSRKGVYKTNGAVLAVIKKADEKRLLPDLFCFALLAEFRGYEPGFSENILKKNYLTWAVLKAHTNNSAGRVTLRSDNPLERPEINFHYFDEGNDEKEADVKAVVEGIKFVRSMTKEIKHLIEKEELPGEDEEKDKQLSEEEKNKQLSEFVKNHAWGHHASCTCPIGPLHQKGVLNGDFEVHRTKGLRVVDASVFPKIPGFFIVSSIYMIGEKAADVILKAAGKEVPSDNFPSGGYLKLIGLGLATLFMILVLIVGSSWFYFEPNSRPMNEDETIADISDLLTDTVRHQYNPKFFLRDTHPKANACVKAEFTVNAEKSDLNVGVFDKQGHTYTSWLRFSNAANVVTADQKPDFRGLAIKLTGVEGKRASFSEDAVPLNEKNSQDFLFVANNTFFAGNPQHFHDFFAACRAGGYSCEPSPTNLPLLWHVLTHPRGAYNALTGQRTYRSIQDIRWFSVAPFEFGKPGTIVKYGVFPHGDEKSVYKGIGTSPNYLTDRLRATLDPEEGKGIKLDFKIQLQKNSEQPIDNTLIAWDEKDSPWQQMALIHIKPQRFDSPEQWEFCQNITFNPWHSLEAHKPIGSLNIARRNVMRDLQKERLTQNGRERFEPTGDEKF